MRRLSRTALSAFGLAAALALAAVPAAPASAAGDTATLSAKGSAEAQAAAAQTCVFYTNGDYVHVSSTPPEAASAHGWWINGNCPTTLADVTVRLQILKNGTWTTVKTSSKVVQSGGGSVARAHARIPCTTIAWNQWRSQVDVDLVGLFDSNEVLTTAQRGLYCGV